MSNWTDDVACSWCRNPRWSVVAGVWTCDCGKPMSIAAIAAMHKVQENIGLSPAAQKMIDAEE